MAAAHAEPAMRHWVACYDIPTSRARIRRKVARLLDGYGERVQFSVFEIKLTEGEQRRLLEQLKSLLDPAQDRFIMYSLTPSSLKDSIYLGDVSPYRIPEVLVL